VQGHDDRNDYGPVALNEGIEFWDAILVKLGRSLESLNEEEREGRLEELKAVREPPAGFVMGEEGKRGGWNDM
jgi:hypothetical protein